MSKRSIIGSTIIGVVILIVAFAYFSGFLRLRTWVEIGRIQFRAGQDEPYATKSYGIIRHLPPVEHRWRVKISVDAYKEDEMCSVAIGYSSSPSTLVLPIQDIYGSYSVTREFEATGTFTLFVVAHKYPQTFVTVIIEEYR